jgi:methionyl-tRNA formyltransferase
MGLRVVFMGTPDFAVASLKALIENKVDVVGVITAPDKPAGRGKKIHASAVKEFAVSNAINNIFQPTNLKDKGFQEELKSLNPDLFVVVAFRMLPESVWNMPKMGTINLHGSLLPNYRGAAPINWAVINGESKTGVTTFFIQHEIDTGNIIAQEEVEIDENDTAGSMHDKLMHVGAKLITETVTSIEAGTVKAIPQSDFIDENNLKAAPKIFKEDCKINWNQTVENVYNFIRGLSPYPAAWTEFSAETGEKLSFKVFESSKEYNTPKKPVGGIDYSEKGKIKIACTDGYISLNVIQPAGKKKMDTKSFLLGFNNKENYTLAT